MALKVHLWDGSGQKWSVSLAAGLRWSRRNVKGRQRVWIAEGRRRGGDSGGMASGRVAVRRWVPQEQCGWQGTWAGLGHGL